MIVPRGIRGDRNERLLHCSTAAGLWCGVSQSLSVCTLRVFSRQALCSALGLPVAFDPNLQRTKDGLPLPFDPEKMRAEDRDGGGIVVLCAAAAVVLAAVGFGQERRRRREGRGHADDAAAVSRTLVRVDTLV